MCNGSLVKLKIIGSSFEIVLGDVYVFVIGNFFVWKLVVLEILLLFFGLCIVCFIYLM